MQLKLITPERVYFAGEITQVQIPGMLGDFGVLPGHAPFVSTIREGVVTIDLVGGETRKISVTGGIAEVTPEQCVVLADSAEDIAA
jgi:F-type H+-transporting ATPase subunit epsilon